MDGLSVFIEKTWEKIKSQKELNLPDQREMVANFRCNELKEESVEKVKQVCEDLRRECDKGVLDNFMKRCIDILREAVDHYDEFAHQYEQTVYKKVKKELASQIIQILYHSFDIQLKTLR